MSRWKINPKNISESSKISEKNEQKEKKRGEWNLNHGMDYVEMHYKYWIAQRIISNNILRSLLDYDYIFFLQIFLKIYSIHIIQARLHIIIQKYLIYHPQFSYLKDNGLLITPLWEVTEEVHWKNK